MSTSADDPPDRKVGDHIRLEGKASEYGRVYQAAGDQTINEAVLPKEALRPIAEVVAPHGS